MNPRERDQLRPAVGARLLLERVASAGDRATYAAWLLTAGGEHAYTAELTDAGDAVLTPATGEGADDLLVLARLTARAAARRAADGLPPWPPRILRWRGPGRGG